MRLLYFKKEKGNTKYKEKDYFKTEISFQPQGQRQQVGLGVLCKYTKEMWWIGRAIRIQMAKDQLQLSFKSA